MKLDPLSVPSQWRCWAMALLGCAGWVSAAGACIFPPALPLTCGQTVQADIGNCNPATNSGTIGASYLFTGLQGQTVVVQVSTPDFGPTISLTTPPPTQANLLWGGTDVVHGNGTPNIATVQSVLNETSELWQILVASDDPAPRGVFTMTLSCFNASANCAGNAQTLCLNAGRFRVTATYDGGGGASGQATMVPLSDDTGYLWFFSEDNVETVAKVVDGCALNGHYWFFAGGLTNVETILTVTDTSTGKARQYRNSANQPFAPIQDTKAFAACP